MASTINASTNSTSGLVYNADASGVLQLQSNGVTGLTVGTGGVVTAANGIVMNTMTLGSPITGEFEYDGGELYFTPLGTQRGLVPSAQYYRLNTALVGSNVNTAQSVFGVGVTLSAGTIYQFEGVYALSKSAGTTSHTTSILFGGTATLNSISYWAQAGTINSTTLYAPNNANSFQYYIQTSAATVVNDSQGAATTARLYKVNGTVSISAGGTFIPQYQLSAAPGGAYTTQPGSYFAIYPVGAAGSNTSVGTWA
jgi:hypothetical protein